jgi:hypothetical protein
VPSTKFASRSSGGAARRIYRDLIRGKKHRRVHWRHRGDLAVLLM